nr:MAG TPA: hypothetical protein [Caudoviricetes sp.]
MFDCVWFRIHIGCCFWNRVKNGVILEIFIEF